MPETGEEGDEDDSSGNKGGGAANLGVEPVDATQAGENRDAAERNRLMGGGGNGNTIRGGNVYESTSAVLGGVVEQLAVAGGPAQGNAAAVSHRCRNVGLALGGITFVSAVATIVAGATTNWFNTGDGGTKLPNQPMAPPTAVPEAPKAVSDRSNGNVVGQTVVVDVLHNDIKASTGKDLDKASVVIVGAKGTAKTLSVAGQGDWSIDDKTGAISFKPATTLKGDPDPISYKVSDTGAMQSNAATVTVYYANTLVSANNDVGTKVTVDLLPQVKGVTPGDVKAFVLIGSATVTGEGSWAIAGTKATFTPLAGFYGDPTPALFEAQGDAAKPLDRVMVRIRYSYKAPQAVDILVPGYSGIKKGTGQSANLSTANPVTVDVAAQAVAGSFAIDPATVLIVGLVQMPGLPAVPKSTPGGIKALPDGTAIGSLSLDVDTEGKWTVDGATGAITFTPYDGFDTTPTTIRYSLADVKSTRSAAAMLSVNPDIAKLNKALSDAAALDDDAFWAAFKTNMVDSKVSIDAVFVAVYMHSNATRTALKTAGTFDTVSKKFYANVNAPYAQWGAGTAAASGYSTVALLLVIEAITDTTTGLGAIALGTRAIRLDVITRMCLLYFGAMKAMMPKT